VHILTCSNACYYGPQQGWVNIIKINVDVKDIWYFLEMLEDWGEIESICIDMLYSHGGWYLPKSVLIKGVDGEAVK